MSTVILFFILVILACVSVGTFTPWAVLFGLGFLGLLVLEVVFSKRALRNDASGGLIYFYFILAPTAILSAGMFLAALIRWLVLHIQFV